MILLYCCVRSYTVLVVLELVYIYINRLRLLLFVDIHKIPILFGNFPYIQTSKKKTKIHKKISFRIFGFTLRVRVPGKGSLSSGRGDSNSNILILEIQVRQIRWVLLSVIGQPFRLFDLSHYNSSINLKLLKKESIKFLSILY